ncbi:hypothetical protein [Pradoshia sp.]|uniref:hypothetical protein n=1 Tax=Pradoshia sp. TaxID=2651281 RepID=UPI003F0DD5BF
MIKVSYNVLGAVVYVTGLALVLQFPGQKSMVGSQLFEEFSLPTEGFLGLSNIWLLAAFIQFIGVLLLVKWFAEEYPAHRRKYRFMEPAVLILAVIVPSIAFNNLFEMGEEVYAHSGQSGAEAVVYIQDESSCTELTDNGMVECSIVLRNFQHHSQHISLVFPKEAGLKAKKVETAYLQQREKKAVKVTFSPEDMADKGEIPTFYIEG